MVGAFRRVVALVAVAALLHMMAATASSLSGITSMVSVSSAGGQGNLNSWRPAVSGTGRFIAFASDASNLVPDDTNGQTDVFVRDRQAGVTERVSLDSAGNQANRSSYAPVISADGRFVAFASDASNLVPGDTNGQTDIFVRDRQTGVTERVSVSSAGGQANVWSDTPAISADGRFVSFTSAALNLVEGDTNWVTDVFVRDRQAGVTERVSLDSAGNQANRSSYASVISADGRFVAFASDASNLVPGDTNGQKDIFVRDRQTGVTERVSVSSAGGQASAWSDTPAISAEGRFVAFSSAATDLVPSDTNGQPDLFVRDRQAGSTQLVSLAGTGAQGDGRSDYPALSADGRYVVFESSATNLVPGDTNGVGDVFIRDRQAGVTERVSVDSAAAQGNSWSNTPAISADGRVVAYASLASNLVPGDTNGMRDVFVQDRQGTPPTVEAGPPATVAEGSTFVGAGYFTDPDPDTWTATVDYGDGSGVQPLTLSDKTFSLSRTYADDGVYTVTVRVADPGDVGSDTTTVTVVNVPPVVDAIASAIQPVGVGASVTATAHFTDAGILDTHTAVWNWGDGSTTSGEVTEAGGLGSVLGSHTYTVAGLYPITLTVTDDDGGDGSAVYRYVVVYDPNGPFVTGGGWIDSPAGAYASDPSLAGKATFGFVSKYQQGTTASSGKTQFRFQMANLSFGSAGYEWLVVSGPKAQFKGAGTINGSGDYGFLLTATDGQVSGGGVDKFRIKIWDKATGAVVYDNQMGAEDTADPTSTLGGGAIVVHGGE